MKQYGVKEAAAELGIGADYLRLKLQAGHFRDIGRAIRPTNGSKQFRYVCYPAKVAVTVGHTITWDGRVYCPDGTVKELEK